MTVTKVLAIDDSPVVLSLIKDILSLEDYEVETASNGREGIEKYPKFMPDIVTLDVAMPGMDGCETLAALKDIDKNANVIMVTATDNSDALKDCMDNGASSVLSKPFMPNDLLEAIGKATETSKSKVWDEREMG